MKAFPMNKACRFCSTKLESIFLNLGNSPIANNYVKEEELLEEEVYYPLCTYVCSSCLLVQLPHTVQKTKIFHKDYAYFSSYSSTWLEHSKNYVRYISTHYNLHPESLVIEVASNDGYLLQYFKEIRIPVLGIDPAESVAKTAINNGIPTLINYFGTQLATELKTQNKSADLLIANNVLAHVPDLNDFIAGFKILLKSTG